MASFFTLPSAGFGGYVALTGSLRGKGRLLPLLRRMEQRMVQDGSTNKGWYIECGENTDRSRFTRHGFREINVDYRQPLLPGAESTESAGEMLHLLYKPFGRGTMRAPSSRLGDFSRRWPTFFAPCTASTSHRSIRTIRRSRLS